MRSLRARLFAATLAALALTLVLTIAIGAVLTRRQVDKSQATSLASRADDLQLQRRRSPTLHQPGLRLGQRRASSSSRAHACVRLCRTSARASDGKTTFEGQRYLYSYRPLPSRGLLLLRSESLRSSEWRPFLRDLLLAGLVGVAFAAGLSFFVARSIVGPIRRVASAARTLTLEDRPAPLPEAGATEIASLARAFNEMAAELADSRDAERAFLLSVSHELKTPLTAIRGYAEGLADGAFGADEAARTIVLEAGRLERLVRDLLDLARMNRSEFSISTGAGRRGGRRARGRAAARGRGARLRASS